MTLTEAFLTTQVAPWYANVHTDVGACATHTATVFEEARESVASSVRAPRCDYSVMFVGSGMTAAVFKLAHLLGLTEPTMSGTGRPVVMYSIMEHHSNCLLWRELDVDTVVLLSQPRFPAAPCVLFPVSASIVLKIAVTMRLSKEN